MSCWQGAQGRKGGIPLATLRRKPYTEKTKQNKNYFNLGLEQKVLQSSAERGQHRTAATMQPSHSQQGEAPRSPMAGWVSPPESPLTGQRCPSVVQARMGLSVLQAVPSHVGAPDKAYRQLLGRR